MEKELEGMIKEKKKLKFLKIIIKIIMMIIIRRRIKEIKVLLYQEILCKSNQYYFHILGL
jgi:hypothetical protein